MKRVGQFLLVFILAIAIGCLLVVLPHAVESRNRQLCRRNLLVLSNVLQLSAMDSTEDFSDILSLSSGFLGSQCLPSADVFRCPANPEPAGSISNVPAWTDYTIFTGLSSGTAPDLILLYCHHKNHNGEGGNIGFVNGQVDWYSKEEFDKIIEQGRLKSIFSDKSIPELIQAIEGKKFGNLSRNDAEGLLIIKHNESVPYLEKALTNDNDYIQRRIIRCLGRINSAASRKVLIRAFADGSDDIQRRSAHALTLRPHPDAEDVYIDILIHPEKSYVRPTIKALDEIKSIKGLPHLKAIVAKPRGWHDYYSALCAVRKIEGSDLPQELSAAIKTMRRAKRSKSVNTNELNESVEIIKASLDLALPDVFDIYLRGGKGTFYEHEPNAKTILRYAGASAYPYIKIGLKNRNRSNNSKTQSLIEELGIEDAMRENL